MDLLTWSQISSIKSIVLDVASGLADQGAFTNEKASTMLLQAADQLHFIEEECIQAIREAKEEAVN